MNESRSTFLFRVPTWIDGAATVLDVGGLMGTYAYSPSGREADRRALEQDYRAVGDDLYAALAEVGKTL